MYWASVFTTWYTKVESSVGVVAQGNDSEDTAGVGGRGGGWLVAETLDPGQERHLETPPPPPPSHNLILRLD